MKFKEIKTSMSVQFQNEQNTFFSTALTKMKDVVLEEVSWGIKISSAKDCVIVSFNNVAYAKPLDEVKPVVEVKSSVKSKSL